MGDDTPLHLAAGHGHRQVVVVCVCSNIYNLYNKTNIQKLLSRKAEVNVQNEHGMTPLHYACFWGYEQICEVSKEMDNQILQDLIRSGALVTMCNKRGLTPLDVCQPQVRQSIYGNRLIGMFLTFIYRNCPKQWTKSATENSIYRRNLAKYKNAQVKRCNMVKVGFAIQYS